MFRIHRILGPIQAFIIIKKTLFSLQIHQIRQIAGKSRAILRTDFPSVV